MLDLTKPVQTRDGRKAVILSTEPDSLVVAIRDEDEWHIHRFYLNGRWAAREQHRHDLMNVPEEETRWVNFYPSEGHMSRQDADKFAYSNRIACVKVTFKRGEGL